MTPPSDTANTQARTAQVLITGLIRNGEKTLRRDVAHLLKTAACFRTAQVLVIESDSTDHTLDELAAMAQADPRIRYLSLGHLADRLPSRSVRLAHCRNAYLDALRTNPVYADVDHVIVADLDGMNDLLDQQALISCFDIKLPWGACFANQAGAYYDIWALRHPDWCPGDCLRELARLEPIFGHETARDIAVYSRQINIPKNTPPIAVQSAFGGLAVYKRSAILSGGYAGLDAVGQEICEHVPHHLKMIEAGHALYINPRMINTGLTIHTRHKRTNKIIRQAIKAHIKRYSED